MNVYATAKSYCCKMCKWNIDMPTVHKNGLHDNPYLIKHYNNIIGSHWKNQQQISKEKKKKRGKIQYIIISREKKKWGQVQKFGEMRINSITLWEYWNFGRWLDANKLFFYVLCVYTRILSKQTTTCKVNPDKRYWINY